MREYLKETLIELCCAYTIISVAGAITNFIYGSETSNANVIIMFVFCAIAVFELSLHKLLALGAGFYYYRVFADAKKQNEMIKQIQQQNKDDDVL